MERARLIDVAMAAGVSRQTAGAVLLGGRSNARAGAETAKRVLEAARRLNYRPNQAARSLKGVRSRLIGVLNRVRSDDDPSHTLITRNLVEELTAQDYMASLAIYVEGGKPHAELVEELMGLGMAGLIMLDHLLLDDKKSLGQVLDICPRTVFYAGGSPLTEQINHYVDINRRQAARLALRHLHSTGRRRVGIFLAPEQLARELTPFRKPLSRMGGVIMEMEALGLAYDEKLVWAPDKWFAAPEPDIETLRAAAAGAVDALVEREKVDAILSLPLEPNATVALAGEIARRGRAIPGDVAIITVRDYPVYRALSPTITAVKLHHDMVAKPMVRMLSEMIESDSHLSTRDSVLVEPELIVRESA